MALLTSVYRTLAAGDEDRVEARDAIGAYRVPDQERYRHRLGAPEAPQSMPDGVSVLVIDDLSGATPLSLPAC